MSNSLPIYIAVVDDDESVRRSFARLLRAAGMEAITYESAEALLADSKGPRFDCAVLDVQLGGMSGIELGRLLALARTPVIYITAHDDSETRARAESTCCAAYFLKSTSGTEVLAAIRKLTI